MTRVLDIRLPSGERFTDSRTEGETTMKLPQDPVSPRDLLLANQSSGHINSLLSVDPTGLVTVAQTAGNVVGPVEQATVAPRTRLVIAQELDAAEKDRNAHHLAYLTAIDKVKLLTAELNDWGKKKRGPRAKKDGAK